MEIMKPLGEIREPDPLSEAFMTLEDCYQLVQSVELHDEVPEDVYRYMEAVKSLFVYGWFCYPFYALAAFLATTAVEMALRLRLPKEGKDRRGLGKLLKQAVSSGVLHDDGFPSVQAAQAQLVSVLGEAGVLVSRAERSYREMAVERLEAIRNEFAHPRGHWIMTPGQALDVLILACEFINQLRLTETQ